jgi:RNA polymerase sigma factor (sigma-70 family)
MPQPPVCAGALRRHGRERALAETGVPDPGVKHFFRQNCGNRGVRAADSYGLTYARRCGRASPMTDRDTKGRLTDWFRQWQIPLRKFLKSKGAVPAADLEDVAQEVFLRLMRYDRTELVEHPRAYLYKMASNVAAEWAIRSRHSRPHDSQWLAGLMAANEPQRSFEHDEAEREVRRAIEALGPKQARMLKLHFFEGLGHAEIAVRVGATQRSVKRMLIKSYGKLRHELDPGLLGEITHGRE